MSQSVRLPSIRRGGYAAGLVASLWIPLIVISPASAQTPAGNIVSATERLLAAGDFAGAVALLRTELEERPDNGDAARLLAQTLYWLQDFDGARAAYDAALARHPQDTTLRLQYARMLMETGAPARARVLAMPLLDNPATRVEANALLGTIAYWQGDLTTARRRFESVLREDAMHADARRQLLEIVSATVPWVRVASDLQHDDQPLDRAALGVDAGWFVTPLTPIRVRIQPRRYGLNDSVTRSLWDAELTVAHFAPVARLDTEFAAGLLQRAGEENDFDWQGRAVLGFRLPGHVKVGARLTRLPYLYTTASLDASLMVSSAAGFARWEDPQGWLGEVAYQRQRYPDGNFVGTVYVWQLIPLVNVATGRFQAGYSFAREHADDSRFVLANPVQPYPPGHPRFDSTGRYAPYYTPSHVITHGVVAALTWRPIGQTTMNLGGTYAVQATEDAPAFVAAGDQAVLTFTPRTLSPWEVRGSVEVRLRNHLTLTARSEIRRTPFYRWSMVGADLTYRFVRNGLSTAAVP
jgi:uncharacterized protein (TIGR02996 family)